MARKGIPASVLRRIRDGIDGRPVKSLFSGAGNYIPVPYSEKRLKFLKDLSSSPCLVKITGLPGTGKTMVVKRFSEWANENGIGCARVSAAQESGGSVIYALRTVAVRSNEGPDEYEYAKIRSFMEHYFQENGRPYIVIVDEAASLSPAEIDFFRTLEETAVVVMVFHQDEELDDPRFGSRVFRNIRFGRIGSVMDFGYYVSSRVGEKLADSFMLLPDESVMKLYRFSARSFRDVNRVMYAYYEVLESIVGFLGEKKAVKAILDGEIADMAIYRLVGEEEPEDLSDVSGLESFIRSFRSWKKENGKEEYYLPDDDIRPVKQPQSPPEIPGFGRSEGSVFKKIAVAALIAAAGYGAWTAYESGVFGSFGNMSKPTAERKAAPVGNGVDPAVLDRLEKRFVSNPGKETFSNYASALCRSGDVKLASELLAKYGARYGVPKECGAAKRHK